jgi:hypothetical protein
MLRKLCFITLLLWLAACSSAAPQETAETEATAVINPAPPTLNAPPPDEPTAMPEQPTAVPTDPPVAEVETVVPTTEAPAEPIAETGVVYGRTPEGAFFQGFADAPITLIDYSDFL